MIPALLLALVSCGTRDVCFGDCVDLGFDPGEYQGTFSARVIGDYVHDCVGDASITIDPVGDIAGSMYCKIYTTDDFGGPLTGRVSERTLTGLWVPSMEIFHEVHSWQVPLQGSNEDEAIYGTFELETDWIDVESGVLDLSIH